MTTHHRYVAVDDVDVFYREAGCKGASPIVLLHGFPTSSHMYRNLIPALAERYHVFAPDLPGFGFTEAPSRDLFCYCFETLTQVLERIAAIISQNGNAYAEGLSDEWSPVKAYWSDPSDANRDALREFLQVNTIRSQYIQGAHDETLVAPEAYMLDQMFLKWPENGEIQLDLLLDYSSNINLYPAFQQYFRSYKPQVLVVWSKNDPLFLSPGADAFRRDNPNAEVHFVDAGHFALETRGDEIASLIIPFLSRAFR